jgi:hypothetical protein
MKIGLRDGAQHSEQEQQCPSCVSTMSLNVKSRRADSAEFYNQLLCRKQIALVVGGESNKTFFFLLTGSSCVPRLALISLALCLSSCLGLQACATTPG